MTRVLGWISGVLLGLGVLTLIMPFTIWIGIDNSPGPYFLAAMLSLLGAWGLHHIYRASPALQSVAISAAFVSVATLTVCIFGAGYIDTIDMHYTTSMKSDLRNVEGTQDDLKRDFGRYVAPVPGFRSSSGVIGPVVTLTSDGWTASVTHQQSPRTCAMFVGSTPIGPAREAREPRCTGLPFDASDYTYAVAFFAASVALAVVARQLERRTLRQPAQGLERD